MTLFCHPGVRVHLHSPSYACHPGVGCTCTPLATPVTLGAGALLLDDFVLSPWGAGAPALPLATPVAIPLCALLVLILMLLCYVH